MADVVFNSYKTVLLGGEFSHTAATLMCAFTTSMNPNVDSHTSWYDIATTLNVEVAESGGYSAGGVELANKTVTQDNTDNEGVFDADDVTWSSVTFTANWAVVYAWNAGATLAPLIAAWDFGS